MRPINLSLASGFSLLFSSTANLSPVSASSLPFPPTSPLQNSGTVGGHILNPSWLVRARNTIIESIWPVSSQSAAKAVNASLCHSSNPPLKLLARYGGDVVLRFDIKSQEERDALASAIKILFLDVWEFTADWVDIRLSKDVVPSLLGLLPSSMQHAHTPLMHDLAKAIYESYPSLTFKDPSPQAEQPSRPFSPSLRPSADDTNIFFREYQPLSVIIPWMRLLRSLFPTHVRLITIGTSYEGREIQALRVGVHPTNDEKPSEPRKTIIVAGGSHAREWISTSTVNYVAYSFITAYGRTKDTTNLLEKFDFIFIPTLNPDGYVYTWESDRLWRKNRQQTALRFCTGFDLDRSYGFEWESDPNSNSPCSESYAGDEPFEAIEAQRFAKWAKNETENNNVEILGLIDLHSYSQQVLYPYSFSCMSAPPSLENLEELAIGLAKAIRTTNGEIYGVTSACEGSIPLYCEDSSSTTVQRPRTETTLTPRIETSGGSTLDWFYHELRVPYAYQLKLRDTGSYGFLLPSENIVPTGKEIFKAVEYFGNFLAGPKGDEESAEIKGVHDEAKLFHPNDQESFRSNDWVMIEEEADEQEFEDNYELRRRRR